jgi:N-acetylneuraminic acid mutarotase
MVVSLLACSWAEAHFLWIVTDAGKGEAKVYFSEGAEPDDPDLLDKVTGLQLLAFAPRDKVTEAAVKKQDDALVAPVGQALTVGLSHRYGVLERGGEKFLLAYHATSHASPIAADWKPAGDRVPLEIVPTQQGKQITLQVSWKGKPVADAQIVAGGAGLTKVEGKTDAEGKFVVEPKQAGLLHARAKLVETETGKQDGQAYDTIRHWTTLTLPVNIPSMQPLEHQLPDVPQGVTSFGGAVAGDFVYIYGGHFGGAHHYWHDGQSGELLRLKLDGGKQWEPLAGGPRRTGTALVAHGGKLYRIGGFEARNAEGDEADLHSMADVGRFDPAIGKWDDFVAMPTPRSSHDAAVLGDTLYVVGGWNLQEGNSGEFLDTMLTLDLKSDKLEWKSATVPFKRRALSVAVHDGKLYAIGGMQDKGGPATTVDVYDPQSQSWSSAPALHGEPMEGFGSTSFEIGGRLTAITRSGAIQQLSSDGKSWEISGYLKHPRFFGRLLPLSGGRGIVVAGADMGSGKVNATEIVGPTAVTAASR